MTAGVWILIGSWVLLGLATTIVLLSIEDREQKRERIAREQGHYPPVLTLKPRAHPRVHLPEDSGPSDSDG